MKKSPLAVFVLIVSQLLMNTGIGLSYERIPLNQTLSVKPASERELLPLVQDREIVAQEGEALLGSLELQEREQVQQLFLDAVHENTPVVSVQETLDPSEVLSRLAENAETAPTFEVFTNAETAIHNAQTAIEKRTVEEVPNDLEGALFLSMPWD